MGIAYQPDGSVICTGNADPSRTATFAAPRGGAAQMASIVAFFASDQAPGVDNSPEALRAAIPVPSNAVPPAVADAGSKGTLATFATGDHTHASKARKQIAVSTAATLAWTYPSPFAAGVVPIVNGIAQVTNGNTDLFNVQIMGVPSNSGCVFQISRVSAGLFGLLTGALGINPTPATINVHMLALEP